MGILQSDLSEEEWLLLITWVGIVTPPTYSLAKDKFKQFHEIIVNKIEESLNFVVKIKSKVYVFHKLLRDLLTVTCLKPSYIV